MPRGWDAKSYDALPLPHTAWGTGVLDRLAAHRLPEAARVLDAGCGTGRDAAAARERWPAMRIVLVDGSEQMPAQARTKLGETAEYVHADLMQPLSIDRVDAVMSVAAFHWVPDHAALFANLAAVVRPGAPLVTDCGGAGNVAGVHQALARVTGETAAPGQFADAEQTTTRLVAAGFDVSDVRLKPDPFRCEDPEILEQYLATVVLGSHLDRLPAGEHDSFVTEGAWRTARARCRLRPPGDRRRTSLTDPPRRIARIRSVPPPSRGSPAGQQRLVLTTVRRGRGGFGQRGSLSDKDDVALAYTPRPRCRSATDWKRWA